MNMRNALKRIATALGALSPESKLLLVYSLALFAVYFLAAARPVQLFALIAGLFGLIAGLLCGLTFWHRARVEIGRRRLKYRNLRKVTGLAAAAGISLFMVSHLSERVTPASNSVSTSEEARWSIMFPPLVVRSGVIYMEPNTTAALTEWRPMEGPTFDSKSACENARSNLASHAKDSLAGAPGDLSSRPLEKTETDGKWVVALELNQSRCISTNAPGLKGK
jgi:hypothetical protein